VKDDTEYFCPMCPGVVSDWPAKCPVCNMTLVRRRRGEAVPLPNGVVARMQLSPYRIQLGGIQTSPVAYRPLVQEVTVTGFLDLDPQRGTTGGEPDPARLFLEGDVCENDLPFLAEGQAAEAASDIFPGHAPFRGRVATVFALRSGGGRLLRVRLEIDNPDRELRPGLLVTARLRTPVERTEPFRSMPTSPPPLQTNDVREVWVCPQHSDDVHEKPGRCPLDQNELEPKLLAGNQRLGWWCPRHPKERADQSGAQCKECNGMPLVPRIVTYHPSGGVLAVPESGVVDTGTRRVVYVERMPGMFDGVEVVLGRRCGEYYPVVRGLEAGQRVATAGAFLIDAEAKLNPSLAASYFGAVRSGAPAAEPSPPSPLAAPVEESPAAKGLGKLSPADQALAAKQKTCPVTGELLGSMGMPPVVEINGRRVFLCCKGCEAALRKEPGKYLSKLDGK
jgi:hypothetical protein